MPATRSRQSTEKPVEEVPQEVSKGEEGVEAVKPVDTEKVVDTPAAEATTEAEATSTNEKKDDAHDGLEDDDDVDDDDKDDDEDEEDEEEKENTGGAAVLSTNGTAEETNGTNGTTDEVATGEKHEADAEAEDASPKKKVKTGEEESAPAAEATA